MFRWFAMTFTLMLTVSFTAQAKPSEVEKARKAADKKLDAFEKTYDASKDLSRKNPEKLEKDITELDAAIGDLKALDASGGAELSARRDTAVQKAREGVATASAGKADGEFEKHFGKLEAQFNPEKKRLEDISAMDIKRAREDLDRVIAKFDETARKPYEEKRDAFFATLQQNIATAKVGKIRSELTAEVPELRAAPGIEAISPMAPIWCDGLEKALEPIYANYHVRDLRMSGDIPAPRMLMNVVIFSCLDSGHDLRQKWVAQFRQSLSNNAGLTAADNERLMKLAAKLVVTGDSDQQQKAVCERFPVLTTGVMEARFSRGMERGGLGCPGKLEYQADGIPLNSVDVPNGVSSQLAGAGLAMLLTTQGFHSNDGKLTGFAIAHAVLPFDDAVFEKELLAMNLNEVGTINAVLMFHGMAQKMKVLEAEARQRSAAVLLDAPKKGVEAFLASLSKTQPGIDSALSLEDQKRSGSIDGCAEKLYPELAVAIKGAKESFDDLSLDGLLAYRLTFCARGDSQAPGMGEVFGYYSERSVPVRGPFTAAYMALLAAHNSGPGAGRSQGSTGFDPSAKRGAAPTAGGPFVPDRNPIEPAELSHDNCVNPQTVPRGNVKSVERQGALTKITFKTEKYMAPTVTCVETGKIDRIAQDGSIVYRQSCKVVGEHEVNTTNEPFFVPTFAAQGVSPGSFLVYVTTSVNAAVNRDKSRRSGDDVTASVNRGWVVEAWESKAQKKRTSLFGIAQ